MDGAKSPRNLDFLDLRTRAEFLELCGDFAAAQHAVDQSLEIAREIDLICYAYQLMWRNRLDDAIELLHYTVAMYPDSWNSHHSLAEALEGKGDFTLALAHYREALYRMDDPRERRIIERRLLQVAELATAC